MTTLDILKKQVEELLKENINIHNELDKTNKRLDELESIIQGEDIVIFAKDLGD